MPEKEETDRTTMLWPVDVKAAVRERVGPRGLTDFTIEAVRAKLGEPVPDTALAESKELGEARFLVQRLADCIAMSGEYEDRESVLREIDLPPWVETIGWPENLARAINPIEPVGVPVQVDTRTDTNVDNSALDSESSQVSAPVEVDTRTDSNVSIDHPYEAGYSGFTCVRMVFRDGSGEDCGAPAAAHVGYEAPGVGDNVIKEPPKSHSNDLFKRLQAKAAEKGVDISGADLVPASQLQVERPEQEVRVESIDDGEPMESTGEVFDTPEEFVEHLDKVAEDEHNHSWSKFEDDHGLYVGQPYFCACGAVMDKERVYERDEVPKRPLPEVQLPTEVAVPLEVRAQDPTDVGF